MPVERKRKEAPAAKRRNCLRERGESREEVGGEGSDVEDSGIFEKLGRWRKAIPMALTLSSIVEYPEHEW